ncbi:signal peptidase I [Thiothrix caldifontis]|uniref:Signal peptidase I n=1 Tax=Thiothrix caldifontis TaxID=525918 RepID=A0A1H4DZU9_9GAMM|nr:signal peptidase I [Thiothrix caldifontis]SEA78294.1 signal peptidase I [Thiothrix caldifontis]
MQTDATSVTKPRKPLLAVLMSALLPGLGQLYNGEFHKAVWLFLGFALLTVPAIAIVALYLPVSWTSPTLFIGLVLLIALWIYGVINAWRRARQQPDYVPKNWQSGGIYVLVFLVCSVIALPLLSAQIRQHAVESMLVPSSSMEPNVLKLDMIFVDKRYNRIGATQGIKRGDIAVFIYPNARNTYYIKRIIGLPGEKVSIQGAEVFINGKPLRLRTQPATDGLLVTETDGTISWKVFWNNKKQQLPQTELHIPPGQVFVLGDNRTDSNDSRFFGTVPLQDVVGKARQVWFSAQGNQVRWERLGKLLH